MGGQCVAPVELRFGGPCSRPGFLEDHDGPCNDYAEGTLPPRKFTAADARLTAAIRCNTSLRHSAVLERLIDVPKWTEVGRPLLHVRSGHGNDGLGDGRHGSHNGPARHGAA
jgi:hypothetical protein